MGGLIARYMLMYGGREPGSNRSLPPLTWEGARNVEKVLLVATPNDGSLLALRQLIEGFRPAPILPKYSAALLGTMPALSVRKSGRLDVVRWAPGDGTVLRASALGDRRMPDEQSLPVRSFIPWTQVMFLQRSHLGLTQDPTFADNVLYTLLIAPQKR